MARRGLRRGALLLTGAAAAVLYSNFLLDLALPGTHDWSVVVSELEIPGRPGSAFLRTTDVAAAVLTLGLLPPLARRFPRSRLRNVLMAGVASFSVGGILAAIVTLPSTVLGEEAGVPRASRQGASAALQEAVHNGVSILSVGGMAVGAAAAALLLRGTGHLRRPWLGAAVGAVAAGCAVALGADALVLVRPGLAAAEGIAQRFQILTLSVWTLALTGLALEAPPRRVGARLTAGTGTSPSTPTPLPDPANA
ncbi:DUF998 domain-containing protein [Brachybacterium sp. ACRRE]|uniref:DUF998 domain-containing protein n=1 Tax=Brachybacterium sp. ACRRE TaxID=2918184 RepID=UPI001EF38C22|nr:DUF998 domain-containing protein [Brachybacterium sp. ACRRE]MCG7308912.1 DUF998 domain-containing protein [Brachybacterium sp. ACRRE]